MDAIEKGARIGRDYISRVDPKRTTVSQIGAMARVCAKRHYKTEGKQQEFVKGWQASTQQFFHLFLGYPTQRNIRGVILECARCGTIAEIQWDQSVDIGEILKERLLPCPECKE